MGRPQDFDMEVDVVVAGYGYAGGMTAVAAHDAGAEVVIFEKMSRFGGNSILSGGSCATALDYEGALEYMERSCGDATDQEVLEEFARGMVRLPSLLHSLANEVGFEVVSDHLGGTYPFAGSESLVSMHVTRNEEYVGFPWASGLKAGGTLFWVLAKHVEKRNVPVHYNSPVERLINDESGAVVGVEVDLDGRAVRVGARRAVVLCTGGFEHNARMKTHYLQIGDSMSVSPKGNTGDGIDMAQKAGAALWHMWHIHGGYGFRLPGVEVGIRHPFGGYRDDNKKMAWIAVDQFGRRFMNEYPPAPQDTPIRALEYYDADIQDYPRIPCYLIFDDEGRQLGPVGRPRGSQEDVDYTWSEDNSAEVKSGLILRADTIEELANNLGLPAEHLTSTIENWNADFDQGGDRMFARPYGTMVPVRTPPFYSIEAWPIITNTQGGPVHNARQQVIDPYGAPIPRLYSAGELGSVFGHLYMLAGNNAECFIAGETAGKNAAAEVPLW